MQMKILSSSVLALVAAADAAFSSCEAEMSRCAMPVASFCSNSSMFFAKDFPALSAQQSQPSVSVVSVLIVLAWRGEGGDERSGTPGMASSAGQPTRRHDGGIQLGDAGRARSSPLRSRSNSTARSSVWGTVTKPSGAEKANLDALCVGGGCGEEPGSALT